MAQHRASPKVNVTIAVDYDFVVWADALADRINSTRSQIIRDAATIGRTALDDRYPPKRRRGASDPDAVPFPAKG